jgi:hypothetical protein
MYHAGRSVPDSDIRRTRAWRAWRSPVAVSSRSPVSWITWARQLTDRLVEAGVLRFG